MRSYSNYLGLDVTAMVDRFKEEISGRHEEHTTAVAPIPDEESRHLPKGWRFVAGIVMLLLIYGAWHLFSNGSTQVAVPPPPSLNAPKAAALKAAPAPSQAASAVPAKSASVNPSGSPAVQPSASMSSLPVQPSIAAKPASADNAVATIGASGGTVYGEQNRNPRVILKAKSDGRITVRGEDGSLYLNRDLKAGDLTWCPICRGFISPPAMRARWKWIWMGRSWVGWDRIRKYSGGFHWIPNLLWIASTRIKDRS